MSVFVKNAGVWKRTKEVHVRNAGLWKETVTNGASNVKVSAGWQDATAAEDQTAGVITQGSDFIYQTYHGFNVVVFGFNTSDDMDYEWLKTTSFGSMTLGADFWDSRGIDRNIAAVYHSLDHKENSDDLVTMTLIGTNIPNDDRTFKEIEITDGTLTDTFLRSTANYNGNTNGGTTWYWLEPDIAFSTSADLTVTVRFK